MIRSPLFLIAALTMCGYVGANPDEFWGADDANFQVATPLATLVLLMSRHKHERVLSEGSSAARFQLIKSSQQSKFADLLSGLTDTVLKFGGAAEKKKTRAKTPFDEVAEKAIGDAAEEAKQEILASADTAKFEGLVEAAEVRLRKYWFTGRLKNVTTTYEKTV